VANDPEDDASDGADRRPAWSEKADTVVLAKEFMAELGGPKELAKFAAEELKNTPPGSHVRSTIIKLMVTLVGEATRLSDARHDADDFDRMMDDQFEGQTELFIRSWLSGDPEKWILFCQRVMAAKTDPAVKALLIAEWEALEAKWGSPF
jgi:hypothetical protein